MRCHDVEESLSEYIDGVLPDERARLVEQHLLKCARCREIRDSMKEIAGYMAEMERVDPPVRFAESINARLGGKPSFSGALRRMFSPVRIRLPLELAGVAAAVILIFYVAQFNLKEKVVDNPVPPAPAEISMPEAEEMKETKKGKRVESVQQEVVVGRVSADVEGSQSAKIHLDDLGAEEDMLEKQVSTVSVKDENLNPASGEEKVRGGKAYFSQTAVSSDRMIRQPKRIDIESWMDMIGSLDGNLLDVQPPGGVINPDSTSIPVILIVEIPVKNYDRFLLELDKLKSTKRLSSKVTGTEGDLLKIQIGIEDLSNNEVKKDDTE